MISNIHLKKNKFKHYNSIDGDRAIRNLSKINIFIGSNNSGKSRCLRTLFSDAFLEYNSDQLDLSEVNSLIAQFKIDVKEVLHNLAGNEDIINRFIDEFDEVDYVFIGIDLNRLVRLVFNNLATYTGPIHTQGHFGGMEIQSKLNEIGKSYVARLNSLLGVREFDFRLKNLYIPTLRGLRNLSGTDKNQYLNTTMKDYFSHSDIEGGIENNIYTGLSLYTDLRDLLLGDKEDRNKVKRFEKFLEETFFNNEEINLIPRIGKEVVYFRIGDHEEHPIYELGDGIQSIIILTYPLFFRQGEKLNFFIEEPEHYLHPGFQRIYIETLLKFENYQYFITTHSNHLLDLTLDKGQISIYTFKKGYNETNDPNFTIENVDNDDSNILASIGVRNSSVFLSNCTIWVEGITDRIYIRKYLELYQQSLGSSFKEDLHYSFVEYGGNNITHWSFLDSADGKHPNIEVKRLCAKLFLITDKDGEGINNGGSKTAKALRQEQLQQNLKENYYCLQSREIENILAPAVLENTTKEIEKNNAIDFNDCFSDYSKYRNEKIGNYIDKKVPILKKKFADESGTVKDKLGFAKKAVNHLSINLITGEALDLTKKLFQFIKSNNL